MRVSFVDATNITSSLSLSISTLFYSGFNLLLGVDLLLPIPSALTELRWLPTKTVISSFAILFNCLDSKGKPLSHRYAAAHQYYNRSSCSGMVQAAFRQLLIIEFFHLYKRKWLFSFNLLLVRLPFVLALRPLLLLLLLWCCCLQRMYLIVCVTLIYSNKRS